jgi:hypothetical protein
MHIEQMINTQGVAEHIEAIHDQLAYWGEINGQVRFAAQCHYTAGAQIPPEVQRLGFQMQLLCNALIAAHDAIPEELLGLYLACPVSAASSLDSAPSLPRLLRPDLSGRGRAGEGGAAPPRYSPSIGDLVRVKADALASGLSYCGHVRGIRINAQGSEYLVKTTANSKYWPARALELIASADDHARKGGAA